MQDKLAIYQYSSMYEAPKKAIITSNAQYELVSYVKFVSEVNPLEFQGAAFD